MDEISSARIPLNQDRFLRQLLGYLAEAIQDVAGLEHAEGLVSIVGQKIGDEINAEYRSALGVARLDKARMAAVLVDLKRRIRGDFYIIQQDEQQIILGNRRCPFGRYVEGRPALCMMTSNVFGVIAAENHGYARVEIREAIASGHAECRVAVNLQPEEGAAGREYFSADD
ncbi:methanogen output domain 1-containing protein [Alcanivorax sp. DP30]|uniref:methanogen output domain 1-containing protein n=1 Tax=Alcanivorax sp. DP30 TaxID=2606217 RepID=UPI00136F04AE|nr:methanogen output domain 1-containing protein [Alcanivorax sp. DP30]MZR62844.1 transcriptional regulator [Alcanivorax sp. DP30]